MHVDRRRGHALVISLIAVGAGVLVGTAAMATVFAGSDRTVPIESANVPLSDSLALVDVIDGSGSTQVTGLLVDDGHHVLVAAEGLDAAERLAVRIGGARTTGTMVGQDPYLDLVLLQLATPSGTAPQWAPNPAVGDSLRVAHFDADGARRSSQVRVEDPALSWSRPDHTVAEGVMTLSGAAVTDGVVADRNGAVAGLVIGAANGRAVAYRSDVLGALVERLHAGGTIEHPWIGVRAGDATAPDGGATKARSETSPGQPTVGALVVDVVPGSPAEAGGVIAGDVITSVAGTPVRGMEDLLAAVAPLATGEVVTVEVYRAGMPLKMSVEVATFPG